MKKSTRRNFLGFLGKGTVISAAALSFGPVIQSCSSKVNPEMLEEPLAYAARISFEPLTLNSLDEVSLAEGFNQQLLISFGDKISDADSFGTHCDYLAFIPTSEDQSEGLLWSNHEYIDPVLMGTSRNADGTKSKESVDKERYAVGGSIVKVKRKDQKWEVVHNDPLNRRLNGSTKIPFLWDKPIAGSTVAEGTFANCSGGITPWGTILTCEENTDSMYGDYGIDENGERKRYASYYGWEAHYDNPPEHYGWVVEVNPQTGEAQKLVSLGRCAHECATMFQTTDGRLVIYSGDDGNDRCLYKYVSDEAGSLKYGTLYVADVENGSWISLKYEDQTVLQENFENQTEVLVRMREAAILVGGSQLARPEDIEIDPITGDVFIALTNNKPKGDFHGSILKIVEDKEDKTGLNFTSETFIAGGPELGFSSPDNMAFDPKGNLWFTTDVSGGYLGKDSYDFQKSNGLYLVPRSGEKAGEIICVASAPVAAEFTGPFFHPDGKSLFLSIQHPGETSSTLEKLTSNWPDGNGAVPKSAVIVIGGPSLETLLV